MTDFKIRRGKYNQLFDENGTVRRESVILELGCWYLCTDEAWLFLCVEGTDGQLDLKQINKTTNAVNRPTTSPDDETGELVNSIIYVEINDIGELIIYYANGETSNLGKVVGEPGKNGLVTSVVIGDTSYEHVDGVITLPSFAQASYVDDKIKEIKIPEIPRVVSAFDNDANYVTARELDAKGFITDISSKADNVLFTVNKFVNKPIGKFKAGDNIKGLTLANLFINMLGLTDTFEGELPDDPEAPQKMTIALAKQNSLPVLQGSVKTSDGSPTIEDSESVFAYMLLSADASSAAPSAANPGTSTIYEITNSSGKVVEHGYQVYTIASGRGTYWRISIAEGLVIRNVKIYDDLQGQWVDYTPTFTDTGERVIFRGYPYVVYQSSDRSNEEILRFIIE